MAKWGPIPDRVDVPPSTKPLDRQVNGDHYKNMKIQPIEFIIANDLGFCEGNIVKYICRHAAKGGVVDIDKVIHYAEILKEQYNK